MSILSIPPGAIQSLEHLAILLRREGDLKLHAFENGVFYQMKLTTKSVIDGHKVYPVIVDPIPFSSATTKRFFTGEKGGTIQLTEGRLLRLHSSGAPLFHNYYFAFAHAERMKAMIKAMEEQREHNAIHP